MSTPSLAQQNATIEALLEREQYAEALPPAKDALFREITEGPTHDICTAYFNLALAYQRTGEHQLAEACYKQVLKLEAALLGIEHANYSDTLDHLANLYLEMGRYADAEEKLRRIQTRDSFDAMRIYALLGIALHKQGKKKEADEAFRRSDRSAGYVGLPCSLLRHHTRGAGWPPARFA